MMQYSIDGEIFYFESTSPSTSPYPSPLPHPSSLNNLNSHPNQIIDPVVPPMGIENGDKAMEEDRQIISATSIPIEMWSIILTSKIFSVPTIHALMATCQTMLSMISSFREVVVLCPPRWPVYWLNMFPKLTSLRLITFDHKVQQPSDFFEDLIRSNGPITEFIGNRPSNHEEGGEELIDTYEGVYTTRNILTKPSITKHQAQRPSLIPSRIRIIELPYAKCHFSAFPSRLVELYLPYTSTIGYHNFEPLPRTLTILSLPEIKSPGITSFKGLPPGITSINTKSLAVDPEEILPYLPMGLTELLVDSSFSLGNIGHLPKSLTCLSWNCFSLLNDHVETLPRGLKQLDLRRAVQLTAAMIQSLPPSLTKLRLPEMTIHDIHIRLLPRSLTSITFPIEGVHDLSLESWKDLPPGLKNTASGMPYVYKGALAVDIMKRLPSDLIEEFWDPFMVKYFPIEGCQDLPRTMDRLLVAGKYWKGRKLESLPSELSCLSLTKTKLFEPGDVSFIPRSLTRLEIEGKSLKFVDQDDWQFPPLLNLLHMPQAYFDDAAIKCLPRSLTHVTARGIHIAGIQNLPDNLCFLQLGGEFSNEATQQLPRSLTSLILFEDTSVTDEGISNLPPSLQYLQMDTNTRISNTGVMLLPRNLITLLMPSNISIDDDGIPYMPKSLKHINLSRNRNITVCSLDSWPPGLELFEVDLRDEPEHVN